MNGEARATAGLRRADAEDAQGLGDSGAQAPGRDGRAEEARPACEEALGRTTRAARPSLASRGLDPLGAPDRRLRPHPDGVRGAAGYARSCDVLLDGLRSRRFDPRNSHPHRQRIVPRSSRRARAAARPRGSRAINGTGWRRCDLRLERVPILRHFSGRVRICRPRRARRGVGLYARMRQRIRPSHRPSRSRFVDSIEARLSGGLRRSWMRRDIEDVSSRVQSVCSTNGRLPERSRT